MHSDLVWTYIWQRYSETVLQDSKPAWLDRLLAELRDSDARAQRVASTLTGLQLNWRASPRTWSIGQCLEHLRAANEVYLPAMATALKGRDQAKTSEIVLPAPSRWFLRDYIAPNPGGTRAKAPRAITPASNVPLDILQALLNTNRQARELILQAANYDVNRIRFSNPFVPLLRFTIGTGLEIVSKHESRHLLQAEGVRCHVDFPS